MSIITTERGAKGEGDMIVKYNQVPISILEIGTILLKLWNNEDKIYPHPRFKGAQMSKDFLDEIFQKRKITDDMLQKYKLGRHRPN